MVVTKRLSGYVLGGLVALALLYTGATAIRAAFPSKAASAQMSYNLFKLAQTQGAASLAQPGIPSADFGSRLLNFGKTILDFIAAGLEQTGKIAAKNALKLYLGNLARGTAEWIANGGNGQTPLFHYKNVGDFLKDQTDAATAEFLDTLGSKYGVNVCNPSLAAKLVIHIGLSGSSRDAVLKNPRCTLQQIQDNWAALAPDSKTFLSRFSLAFEPDQNDLGLALKLQQQLLVDQRKAEQDSILSRLEDQGVKAVTTLNGLIKTPSNAVRGQIDKTLGLSTQAETSFIGDPIADALSIFVNSLGAKLQQKWLKGGFANLTDVFSRASGNGSLFGGVGNISTSEPRFAALAEVSFGNAGTVDVLSDLSNCSSPASPGYGNQCVIESSFRQAIEQKLTVNEAMQRGLLHSEWPFGYLADGAQPSYNSGYPYSSMVVLRTKRIVPVGWELAAQAARAFNVSLTLERVLHCYEDPTAADDATKPSDCLQRGINPFYHLVDPNWALQAPTAYCTRRGSSPELLTETFVCNEDNNSDGVIDCANDSSGGLDSKPGSRDLATRLLQRVEYCADEQSCVAENPDGSCRAYGYCYEEKPIFNLGGQSCPAQFASCIGLTTPSGQRTAYIRDSVQSCPNSAAGCSWYSQRPAASGEWSSQQSDRIYLNGQTPSCNPEDAGCRTLLRFGQGTNLVPNGSFEQFDSHDSRRPTATDNFFILEGSAAGQAMTNAGEVHEGQSSFHLTRAGDFEVRVETGSEVASRTFSAAVSSKGCDSGTLSVTDEDHHQVGTPATLVLGGSANDDWHTAQLSGTTASPGTSLTVHVNSLGPTGGNCYLDSLSLTEGSQPTSLDYGSGRAIHVKATAKQCSPDDVGCQAYTPTNGDPTVFGRVAASDQCPAQCVGYQNFAALATVFERSEAAAPPPAVNFIPSTARSCSAATAGCSEFTNLDEVPAGGERTAYFSQVQQCVGESSANVGTYYTWEGSDTAGYQLRVWHLLDSPVAPPPLEGGTMPCTNLSLREADLDPATHQPRCMDNPSIGGLEPATCSASSSDPDCREVFDSNAVGHHVLWTRVVQSSASCHPYRRTGTDFVYHTSPALARTCPAAAAGCRQYRGPTSGNTRTALRADFESASASGWSAGGGGVALATEALQVGGHSLMAGASAGTVVLHRSEPIVMQPGHQYLLTAWVKGTSRDVPASSVSLRSAFGKFASLFGWSVNTAGAQPAPAENLVFNASGSEVGGEWQLVHVGPVSPVATSTATTMTFDLRLTLAAGMRSAFIDNLLVKEITGDVFVVENSWNTPQACDNPAGLPEGTPANPRTEPGAMVGCSQYRLGGQTTTLRSFTRLCEQANVGCQAFIDTSNSGSPFQQQFNRVCSLGSAATRPTACVDDGYERCVVGTGSTSCRYTRTDNWTPSFRASPSDPEDQATVAADHVAYVVDNPATYCSAAAAGCTQVGLPDVNKQLWDGTGVAPASGISNWADRYKIINPDQFNQTLCVKEQLWCASHALTEGGSLTLKDPQAATPSQSTTCEYRTNVDVSGSLVTGWFKSGTTQPCGPRYTLPLTATPSSYHGYVGICPTQYSSCTDFSNPQLSLTGGQSHNYFLRAGVDSASCNGLVDLAGGCLLFNDPAQPSLYSSTLSYPPNRLPGQAPVSTSTNDSNIILKVHRDRMCAAWYTCENSVTFTDASGNQHSVCTAIASCSQLDPATGQCQNTGGAGFQVGRVFPAAGSYPGEFTFSSPDDSSKWRNLSGYTVAGIQYGVSPGLISRGQMPLSRMPQVGIAVDLVNGGFDDATDSLVTSSASGGWSNCAVASAVAPTSSSNTACVYTSARDEVHDGVAALRLHTNVGESTELVHDGAGVSGNTTYLLAFDANTLDLSGEDSPSTPARLHVWLVQRDGAGAVVDQSELASVDAGSGWQTRLISFDTAATTQTIQIKLRFERGAAGNALVDAVRLDPALQLNSQPRYAGQQCRVYPRSDAPSCRYQLPDALYRGINGYCIQPDPRDLSLCLQWWPVDLVAGQSFDLFGSTNVSLGLPDPLRYCTQAKGNAVGGSYWWDSPFDVMNPPGNTGASVHDACDTSSSEGCPMPTLPGGGAFAGSYGSRVFYEPNDSSLWDIHWSEVAAIVAEGHGGFACDGKNYRIPISLGNHTFTAEEVRDSSGNHDDFVYSDRFGFFSDLENSGSNAEGAHWAFFGVDQATGRINRFISYLNDQNGGGENCNVTFRIVRKEQCSVVAEVGNGTTNAAWYNRFRSGYTSPTLPNAPSDDATPYGALSDTEDDNLETRVCDPGVINSGTISTGCALPVGLYAGGLGGSVDRAGTPLACPAGGCAPMHCTANATNRCGTSDDISACFGTPSSASRYCVGNPSGRAPASSVGTFVEGANRLSEVFARSYSTWTLEDGKYQPHVCTDAAAGTGYTSAANGCWDLRWTYGSSSRPIISTITVDGQSSGSVNKSIGQPVEIKFTSQLSLEHKPLQYICVDWDGPGGSDPECHGKLNIDHQPNPASGHRFTHTYEAAGVYRPTVQIEDNWGFCNGSGTYVLDQNEAGCPSESGFASPVTVSAGLCGGLPC